MYRVRYFAHAHEKLVLRSLVYEYETTASIPKYDWCYIENNNDY